MADKKPILKTESQLVKEVQDQLELVVNLEDEEVKLEVLDSLVTYITVAVGMHTLGKVKREMTEAKEE